MNSLDRITQFISTITWDQPPETVQRKARMCLVDNFGATLAGTLMWWMAGYVFPRLGGTKIAYLKSFAG